VGERDPVPSLLSFAQTVSAVKHRLDTQIRWKLFIYLFNFNVSIFMYLNSTGVGLLNLKASVKGTMKKLYTRILPF
jgi:hypothetical protein